MRAVYATANCTDAHRFANLLLQSGITATVESAPADSDPGARYDVVVSAEDEVAAQRLLPEFHAIFREPPVDEHPEEIHSSRVIEPIRRCRIPAMTLLFCGLCIAVFYAVKPQDTFRSPVPANGIAAYLTGRGAGPWEGAFWAPVTSVLVHVSPGHLWEDLVLLVVFGAVAERILGHALWVVFMVATAIAAPLILLSLEGTTGVGSSGLVFACFAFTLLAAFRQPTIPLWILIPLSIWMGIGIILDVANVAQQALYGDTVYNTNSGAHLTGFLRGLLVAAGAVYQRRWLTGVGAGLLVIGGVAPLCGPPLFTGWKYYRADRALRIGDSAEAHRLYSDLLALTPEHSDLYITRGTISLYDSQFDAAIADFTEALRLNPAQGDARVLRSSAYQFLSELDLALADANDELLRGRASVDMFVQRGNVQMALANWKVAESDFSKAIEFDKGSASAYASRGTLWLETAQFQEALDDFNRALDRDPQNITALAQRGYLWETQGAEDLKSADFQSAERLVSTQLQLHPREANSLGLAATILVELQQFDEARPFAERVTELAPKSYYSWNVRAFYELRSQRPEAALEHIARALALNPRDVWNWQAQGEAHLALGNAAEAAESFSGAIRLNPRFLEAHQRRAEAYAALGDDDQAAADRERATELLGPPLRRPGK